MPGILDHIERLGNRLPHPASLFALATVLVMVLSAIAVGFEWQVEKPAISAVAGSVHTIELIDARSLLSSDGIWWLIAHLVPNFIAFPPLGIVLVGMLGIGVAERSGFIPALLHRVATSLRGPGLTPAVVFLGIMSSLGLDAGYVVLPPIAAALYLAAGRSPLVGVAASFAGISAGFSANLLPTAVDPLLTGFTEAGAHFLDPAYRVAVTANWWYMIASTIVLTGVGWLVTAFWVEPRTPVAARPSHEPRSAEPAGDLRALRWALAAIAIAASATVAIVILPGAPLHGMGDRFPRWIEATVPAIFVLFLVPGIVYGYVAGSFRTDRDLATAMGDTFAALGPYIVLAFFAAQFIEAFKYSGLGEMLAISGGRLLMEIDMPRAVLLLLFVGIVMLGNLLVGSASAKYAFFAPVFVPMFMQVGISPELTQATYRMGDSITNVITPLNPYMVIIVALVQRYASAAGLGTIISLMLPYTLAFALAWCALLLVWLALGIPLGPGGPLVYG